MITGILRQSSQERIRMITEGGIVRTLCFLSIPGAMMILIQALMPVIDSIFIYNFDDPLSGAAISYIASIQNVFVNGALGISMAGSAIIGQVNGTGDLREGRRLSAQLMSVSFCLGLVLIPVLIVSGMLAASTVSGELSQRVFVYNLIYSFSLPLVICSNSFNSVKNVAGHPEIPFFRALMFVPAKLLCTYLFVAVWQLGIRGAAYATFTAYFIISVFIVYDLFFKPGDSRLLLSDLRIRLSFLQKLFFISWPAALQNSLKSIGFFVLRLDAASFGDVPLTGFSCGSDVSNLFNNFTLCMESSITSMVSINMGARRADRAKKTAYCAVGINMGIAVCMTALSVLLGPWVVSLYTSDPAIAQTAVTTNWIISLGFIGFAVMFNEMPTLIGLGQTKLSLVVQMLRIWVFRIVAFWAVTFFFPELGIATVAVSYCLANLAGGVVSHLLFGKIDWNHHLV